MDFEITLRQGERALPDAPRGLRVSAGDIVFTSLLRPGASEADDFVEAPPAQLAFWLIDNWWRLRWEGVPPAGRTPEWRLAHELASIGGGYVWPSLALWGEDTIIRCASRSDPPGVVGPVRYLTDANTHVPAESFERACDHLVGTIIEAPEAIASDAKALAVQWRALHDERQDDGMSAWRRLEARLGYDPDEAPAALMERLGEWGREFAAEDIEEAAMAAPGPDAAIMLATEVETARIVGLECDFSSAVGELSSFRTLVYPEPWQEAERAAQAVRSAFGVGHGPMRTRALADLAAADPRELARGPAASGLTYGLRLARPGGGNRVALRARRSAARRFELARALGDAVWTGGSSLGAIGDATTARQKFQRAFAQSLLCPFEGLAGYLGDGPLDAEAIGAAAQYFHVSERVVWTALVNKGWLDRNTLQGEADCEPILDEGAVAAANIGGEHSGLSEQTA